MAKASPWTRWHDQALRVTDRLRGLVAEHRKTGRELARDSEGQLSPATVARLLRGDRELRVWQLLAICDLAGIDLRRCFDPPPSRWEEVHERMRALEPEVLRRTEEGKAKLGSP
jgi:Cro/C1-type HTH DNA-binding domain